jgi:hypothetical protein
MGKARNRANYLTVSHRDFTMITFTRVGIAIFTLAVVFGPLYTVAQYSVVTNLISELGAQHTQNNLIMIIAFVLLGGGIAIDGVRTFRVALLPFILFSLRVNTPWLAAGSFIRVSNGCCRHVST